jgi:hypothetical protein
MKKQISGLVIILLLIWPMGSSCGEKYSKRPGRALEAASLLPADGEIEGWKRFGEMFKASNDLELYKCIDGGAGLYINHGFQVYAGQLYRSREGLEVEVAIYDQGSARNARGLYQDPLTKADPEKVLRNLGDEARIDERGLFVYGVEFIQDRFFVRVLIQDRTENGLSIALLFAHHVSQRIK